MSKQTIVADSTQIQMFLECPQRWAYNNVKNIVMPSDHPSAKKNDAMNMGTYGHVLLENYYKLRAAHVPLNDAIAAMLETVAENKLCTCGHLKNRHKVLSAATSVCSLCSGKSNFCHPYNPAPYPISDAQQQIVKSLVQQHCLLNYNHDIMPFNEGSVELGFSKEIYSDSEYLFVLEGKIDVYGTLDNQVCFMDHKFQATSHDLYERKIQFRNYAFATNSIYAIVNYLRMAPSAKEPLCRKLIGFTKQNHQDWRGELVRIFKKMAAYKQTYLEASGTLAHPESHNWSSCEGQWGSPCQYHLLCEQGKDERTKENLINFTYVNKEEWKPW